MSIETNFASIAKSLERIATALENSNTTLSAVTPATATLGNLVQAAAVATAPVVGPNSEPPIPTQAPTPTPTTAMPAGPSFMAAPTPAAATLPFNDGKGLVEYVMAAYKAMGPEKGANIQGVLVNLGYQNINDVKPEHYAQVHAGIEALK